MTAVIFAGPSFPPSKRPAIAGLEWRPPLCRGDLYLTALDRPSVIGVVDGYFETVPTVWHKEILWAMARGIYVYGAASIGALRAAELADFGMIGVGHVYREFRSGGLSDDDEVAVLHGPAELDYVTVTEAMVNVRSTIECALQSGIVEPTEAAVLLSAAKSLFYKDRTYDLILKLAAERGLAPEKLQRFADWLSRGKIDQKRIDAEEMLSAIAGHVKTDVTPFQASYEFAHTFAWEEARQTIERASFLARGGLISVRPS
jgi:hypothetical protein